MQSIPFAAVLLSIAPHDFLENTQPALQHLQQARRQLDKLIRAFHTNPIAPLAFYDFERELHTILRETGRHILQTVVNSIEPELASQLPKNIENEDSLTFSRKNQKSNNRDGIGSVFGVIFLSRFLFEPLTEAKDQQQKSFSPLEALLGIVARNATLALAERAARDAASMTQSELAEALRRGGIGPFDGLGGDLAGWGCRRGFSLARH